MVYRSPILTFIFFALIFFISDALAQTKSEQRIWSCKVLHDNKMGMFGPPNSDNWRSNEFRGGRITKNQMFELKINLSTRTYPNQDKESYASIVTETSLLLYGTDFELNLYKREQFEDPMAVANFSNNYLFSEFGVGHDFIHLSYDVYDRQNISRTKSLTLVKRKDIWQGSITATSVGQLFDLTTSTLHFVCNGWYTQN